MIFFTTMKTDLAGKIQNTSLPKKKALLPMFEAIVNSIQAIEDAGLEPSQGKIKITLYRENLLDEKQPVEPGIESITIQDNGVGLNADNYKSFSTAESRYKKGRGGKGIGRF